MNERSEKFLRLVEENLAKEGGMPITCGYAQKESEIVAHACTQETIDGILARIRATDPEWAENIEKVLQEPVPLEKLISPEITGERLVSSAGYKHLPYGELDKSASGNGR